MNDRFDINNPPETVEVSRAMRQRIRAGDDPVAKHLLDALGRVEWEAEKLRAEQREAVAKDIEKRRL